MSALKPYSDKAKILGISSQLDRCPEDYAVFYRLAEGDRAQSIFAQRLEQSKASIVFVSRDVKVEDDRVVCLAENNFEKLIKSAVDEFYPVNKGLKLVAITGTNGKTSTVHLLSQLLRQKNMNVLSIGTLGIRLNDEEVANEGLTTPGLPELRAIIAKYQYKLDFVVMEASSHALEQDRLYGLEFDVAGWSNLTQDHLDYHQTMDKYFESKLLITQKLKDQAQLYVSEHELFKRIEKRFKRVKLVAQRDRNNVVASLKTHFAQKNLNLALSLFTHFGYDMGDLTQLNPPPGRFETLVQDEKYVIIDYAHTPDALINACLGVKMSYPGKSLVTIFGCGGDRDKSKRPLMLEAALKNSSRVIVTSDNPRSEDPQVIISDIVGSLKNAAIICEVDRRKAIEFAIKSQHKDEVILIAGKGHEAYQEIKGVKHPFDDIKVAKEALGI
ncbi:MAG: hypothetical protein CME71_10960 [Halobacteriovorax sp.]|nr:hypothetical protein [Halobacteriovorax sp.]